MRNCLFYFKLSLLLFASGFISSPAVESAFLNTLAPKTAFKDAEPDNTEVVEVQRGIIVDFWQLRELDTAKSPSQIGEAIPKKFDSLPLTDMLVLTGWDRIVARESKLGSVFGAVSLYLARRMTRQLTELYRTSRMTTQETHELESFLDLKRYDVWKGLLEALKNAVVWGNRNKRGSYIIVRWKWKDEVLQIDVIDEGSPWFDLRSKSSIPDDVESNKYAGYNRGFQFFIEPHLSKDVVRTVEGNEFFGKPVLICDNDRKISGKMIRLKFDFSLDRPFFVKFTKQLELSL